MSEAPPLGQRFTHVYVARGAPMADSRRARSRIGSYVSTNLSGLADDIARAIHQEIGVKVPYTGISWDLEEFAERCSSDDFFDSITVVWRSLNQSRYGASTESWVQFVNRVFGEENLHYRVDTKGGVHFEPDKEYAQTNVATVAGLGLPRYSAALDRFRAATRALDGAEKDTLGAVRGVFDAVENVFKLSFPATSRIGSSEIDRELRPRLQSLYNGNDLNAAKLMASSLSDWVNSAHHYRHAPGQQEPSPPPLEVALALVGTGAAFLRWLVQLDQWALEEGGVTPA